MSTSTASKRLTRSQTASSVLGKRSSATLSRSSSMMSTKSLTSLLTPDSTPDAKRARTTKEEVDPHANKENVPPLRDLLVETPSTSRLTRRASISSDISSTSSRSSATPRRRNTQAVTPYTPATALSSLAIATPPPTPPFALPLHLRVRSLLRATTNSSHGMSMSGREGERAMIESFLHSFDDDSKVSESVLYISGSPGTGKTALVNAIIASTDVCADVKLIFLNCMAITNMDALWERLAEELAGASASGKTAKRASGRKPQGRDGIIAIFEKQRDLKCMLVLDELDNLSGSSPSALQPLFNLAASHPSSLRVMGIANTHTLTSTSSLLPFSLDSTNSSPPSSPSKSKAKNAIMMKTIHFAPYTSSELLAILNKRLDGLPQDELKRLLPQPALILLTKKVAALTGDVRVLFEVLRGAIDLAVPSSFEPPTPPSSPSPGNSSLSVTPAHILSALKSYTPSSAASNSKSKPGPSATSGITSTSSSNSETATKVRGLGLQARLVLLALVLTSKRLSASLSLSSSSSPTSPTKSTSSPAKRSPMKRSSSSATVVFGTSDSGVSGIDSTQLHAFYSALLTSSDMFSPVSRPDFTDILGVLETTGLVLISSPSTRVFKRSASFAGKAKGSSAGGAQVVSLQGDVREAEVARGLGIGPDVNSSEDALEDEVRAIWERETMKIRREVKAKGERTGGDCVISFDDAMED